MALRPSKRGKEHILTKIYEAIQRGELKGISPNDVNLVIDPEHAAFYDIADELYYFIKGVESFSETISKLLEYFKKEE